MRRPASGATSRTTSTSPSGETRARAVRSTSPRAAPWASTAGSTGVSGRPRTARSARRSRSSPTPCSSSAAAPTPRAASASSCPPARRPTPTWAARRPTTTSRSKCSIRQYIPASGPLSRGARGHPPSHQYFIQYCLRASAASGLVLATQKLGGVTERSTDGARRRQGAEGPARRPPAPADDGAGAAAPLLLLQGEDRGGGLEELQPAPPLRLREGQDPLAPDHRHVPPAPASGRGRRQARPRDGSAALRDQLR